VSDGSYNKFFARLDESKDISFDRRVCHDLLKGWGLQPTIRQFFRGEASTMTNSGEPTPEWLSQYVGCPVLFRAVRDYHLERVFDPDKDRGVPDPNWLMSHRIDGPKTKRFWNRVWLDTQDQFGEQRYLAACFRVSWFPSVISFHNYLPALSNKPSQRYPVRGGCMVWQTRDGVVVLQHLRDLLSTLSANWRCEPV